MHLSEPDVAGNIKQLG